MHLFASQRIDNRSLVLGLVSEKFTNLLNLLKSWNQLEELYQSPLLNLKVNYHELNVIYSFYCHILHHESI